MSNSEKLAFSILDHLSQCLNSGTMAGDTAETLEVAIQCLEQVFKVESYDEIHKQSLKVDKPLQEIFDAYTKEHFPDMPETTGGTTVMQPTANARERAEQLKAEGNQLMKIEKYPEAINCYTQAIALDNTNPVYPCNRAAAYSKLAEHQKAVDDCKRALKLDPKYSKAYGRMGLSYQNMNDLPKAQESYQKAIELEPENVFYKNNLRVIEEGLSQASSGPARGVPPGVGAGAGMPNLGGVDFASLFSNPAVMNMAQTFMQSPQMQQMVSGMMTGGAMGGGGATGGGGGGAAPGGGMGQLFQAAQQFGEQLQESDPNLMNELRTQAQETFHRDPNSNPFSRDGNPPEEKGDDKKD